ncbi:hypothetical protein R1sor_019362 [Riccia sorocarpa]|uniref:N-acetyltransferase domain-containing protein n=1 Tax=Riccia sorocarpa TaxID=122646 RepID=A0ABD3ICB3_9MARC
MAIAVPSCSSLGFRPESDTFVHQFQARQNRKLVRKPVSETSQVSLLLVINTPSGWTKHSAHSPATCPSIAAVATGFLPNVELKNIPSGRSSTVVRALSTETAEQLSSSTPAESAEDDLNLVLELARSEEKLRAAAALRARSFYTYPEDRSEGARKMHQQMKADDEWAVLTRKIGGLEEGYPRTSCVVALCPSSGIPDSETDLHEICKVTGPQAESYLLVGTLDLNQGLSLPGEITGEQPAGPEAEYQRGYLSNVCVAEEARRRGVGMVLVEHAKTIAKLWGVSDLYVHVVVENISARKLYEKAGFVYEKEESVKEARSLGRPRRYLLRTKVI